MAHIVQRRTKRRLSMAALQHAGPDLRLVLYVQMSGRCWYCGAEVALQEGTVDHVQPVVRGGTATLSNTVFACRACNREKGCLSLDQYRERCGSGLFWGEARGQERRRA